jgi:hypothetical protein
MFMAVTTGVTAAGAVMVWAMAGVDTLTMAAGAMAVTVVGALGTVAFTAAAGVLA